jgi:hypothetical protein
LLGGTTDNLYRTASTPDEQLKVERSLSRLQAIVRANRARREYERIVRNEAYRANVAKEILQTERSYVESLKFVQQVHATHTHTHTHTLSLSLSLSQQQ